MHDIVSVFSKVPNLACELKSRLPHLQIKDIRKDNDYTQLYKSEIIVGELELLLPHLNFLEKTKWIQGTRAGVENEISHYNAEKFDSIIVSRFSGTHFGKQMSEYVVANIVNYERNFFYIFENKKEKVWAQNDEIHYFRTISDLRIGILGVGTIGNRIAQTLRIFGAEIWGFGKREKLPETIEYSHYKQYCNLTTLPKLLKHCDYVVNVLPATEETKGLLNGNLLKNCADKKTVFINIGRGSIISTNDLVRALSNKWITAAILDVFENEPLPKENPLWDLEQVFITPHISGTSRAKDIAEQFEENLYLYKNNQKIPNQLVRGKNY